MSNLVSDVILIFFTLHLQILIILIKINLIYTLGFLKLISAFQYMI